MCPARAHAALAIGVLVALTAAPGCNKPEPALKASGEAQSPIMARTLASLPSAATAPQLSSEPIQIETKKVPPPAAMTGHSAVVLDEWVVVAPAAPATASASGVVLITRNDEVRVAALGALSLQPRPAQSPLKPLNDSSASFTFSIGPGIGDGFAYWISGRRLVRQAFDGTGGHGDLEVLATDAQPRTRVALPAIRSGATTPLCAAYLAQASDDPTRVVAKLWSPHSPLLTLTEPGAAASSVGLDQSASALLAWSIEGRTGMTPVHAREIHFDGEQVTLSGDRVVWIGGESQSATQINPVAYPHSEPRALIAMEQDATAFGLLDLTLPATAHEAESQWSLYANGIDPAPVASGLLCGSPVIVRAVPQSKEARSERQLELIDAQGTAPPLVLHKAQRFFDVSLAPLPGGALLVAVTDQQTVAMTMRCRKH